MNMKRKYRQSEPAVQTALPAGVPDDAESPMTDTRNVLVTHGIHRGRFPVGKMTIREARQVLEKLINIDPDAVPVINGSPVEEEQIIGENVTTLSFVKPSSIKG